MTSSQLENIDKLLIYTGNLAENYNVRQNLIKFFHQIKLNWDNYQLGKSLCSVTTNWEINSNNDDDLKTNGLTSITSGQNYQFRPVLSALFYKYLVSNNYHINLYLQINESFNIENDYKNNARKYFKEQCQCLDSKINTTVTGDNYQKYYFVQPQKYLGNK